MPLDTTSYNLFSLFFKKILAGNFKIFVATGTLAGGNYSNSVEIVDLVTNSSVCPPVTSFPVNTTHAMGFWFKDRPMICGGFIAGSSQSSCYVLSLSKWEISFPLNVPRAHAAVSPSPFQNSSQLFIMTGGYQNHVPLSSVEILATQGWEILAPSIPVTVYDHCTITTSFSTMVIGGIQNEIPSAKTFFISNNDRIWRNGPSLNYYRYSHSCARIPTSGKNTNKMSTIAVGGYEISSTELLDDGDDTWRMGPRMPWQLWGHGLVEDPRGGVILIAGATVVFGNKKTIYRLENADSNSNWEIITQTLKNRNQNFVSFIVPDSFINCVKP